MSIRYLIRNKYLLNKFLLSRNLFFKLSGLYQDYFNFNNDIFLIKILNFSFFDLYFNKYINSFISQYEESKKKCFY